MTRFTEKQILSILQLQVGGISTKEIGREHSISEATFYNWKSRHSGVEISNVERVKGLEDEKPGLRKWMSTWQ